MKIRIRGAVLMLVLGALASVVSADEGYKRFSLDVGMGSFLPTLGAVDKDISDVTLSDLDFFKAITGLSGSVSQTTYKKKGQAFQMQLGLRYALRARFTIGTRLLLAMDNRSWETMGSGSKGEEILEVIRVGTMLRATLLEIAYRRTLRPWLGLRFSLAGGPAWASTIISQYYSLELPPTPQADDHFSTALEGSTIAAQSSMALEILDGQGFALPIEFGYRRLVFSKLMTKGPYPGPFVDQEGKNMEFDYGGFWISAGLRFSL